MLRIAVGFKVPPPVPVGTSYDVKVGQKVFAIRNPFDLDWTYHRHRLRARPRARGRARDHQSTSSGPMPPSILAIPGVLLDSAGRPIGINTAICSPSGANAGIGFAVPVDMVNRLALEVTRNGCYLHPVLGTEAGGALNQRLTALLGVEGVVVLRVPEGTAAPRAACAGPRCRPTAGSPRATSSSRSTTRRSTA